MFTVRDLVIKYLDLARAASTARANRLPSLVRAHSSMAARHFFAASGSRLCRTCNKIRMHVVTKKFARAAKAIIITGDKHAQRHVTYTQTTEWNAAIIKVINGACV